ncbi:MAG: hypothetical protein NW203_02900 [Hyphomonadaceae bacterium]|nr:hypothetical protein [Hyphomonadaceae bacterium]
MKHAAFAAALAVVLAAGAAHAQSGQRSADYQTQVRGYLDTQAGKHTSEGFRRDGAIQDFIAPMRLEGGAIWPVTLQRGVTYRVFAVCDNDCSDVDLEVYDVGGGFVGRDIATNDTPYVQITPQADGVVYARLWLAACESEPCYVGARVFRR